MNKIFRQKKGFTLVEIIFALFIGILIMGAVYFSMVSGKKSSVALESKISAQQDVRAVLEIMAMEIGMASYNPNFVTGIWRDPGDCSSFSSNQSYKGIQTASSNSIIVEMDIDDSGVVRDNSNEIISYNYDTANQRITRATNCGGAQAFLGDVSGNPRSVRVINNTLNIPIFRYYDGQGNEIAAGSLPAAIPSIRRIEITLAVETEEIDPNTNQRRRMIYSTSVIPRNHAILQ
jgi:type IV pilus assembly protein PilW